MVKYIVGAISFIAVGAGVPIVGFMFAYANIDKMTTWGWVSMTVISVVAIAAAFGFYVVSNIFNRSKSN